MGATPHTGPKQGQQGAWAPLVLTEKLRPGWVRWPVRAVDQYDSIGHLLGKPPTHGDAKEYTHVSVLRVHLDFQVGRG